MSLLIISWSQSPLPDFSVFQDLNVFSCFSTETTDDHTYFLFLSSGLCCSRNDQNVWEANTVLRIPSLLVVDYTMFLISHQLRIRCCGLLSQMINLTSHFLPTYLSPSYFFASCSSFPYIPHLHHHQFPPPLSFLMCIFEKYPASNCKVTHHLPPPPCSLVWAYQDPGRGGWLCRQLSAL